MIPVKLVGCKREKVRGRRRMDQETVRGATISGCWRLPVRNHRFSLLIGLRVGMKQNSIRQRLISAPWRVRDFQAMHSWSLRTRLAANLSQDLLITAILGPFEKIVGHEVIGRA